MKADDPALHLAGNLHAKGAAVEERDALDAGRAGAQRLEAGLGAQRDRRDKADACDDDAFP